MGMLYPNNEDILPIGYMSYWGVKESIPFGWIPVEVKQTMFGNGQTIIIQKVDNLTYVEHLAKQKNLV